ncbi:TVP38/TMEM64 family protein [Carpediemonas membranifera]|uniref:TVP38/TMEM64 family protein n=1 Tax=Carpediemonas membranifera TaxID=201153 RepID=A0A8J6AXK6_9EUKA|nr:TVP38/TMEM64 family protein [Carpediemonas membranifera]|eukprot:KAG9397321.1 TVP38/TMEM64 family protein [Carpediemonas membranifera]
MSGGLGTVARGERRLTKKHIKFIIALALFGAVGGLIVAAYTTDFKADEFIVSVLEFLQDIPLIVSAPVFALIYTAWVTCLLPGTPLVLGAGFTWGFFVGTFLVWLGCVGCETSAFFIARFALNEWIENFVAKKPKLKRLRVALTQPSTLLIFLTRLSPLFPFPYLNYIYGVTKARFVNYILASAIGCLPGVLLYTYLGSLLHSLADLSNEGLTSHLPMFICIITLTVVLFAVVTVLGYREINKNLAAVGAAPGKVKVEVDVDGMVFTTAELRKSSAELAV